MKISKKIKDNKIFFIVFGLLVISSVAYISEKGLSSLLDPAYSPLYVVNYDCGFSSRLLVGSVFSLFFNGKLDVSVLTNVLLIVYFLVCLSISLFINRYLKGTQHAHTAGIYITFIVLSPIFLALLQYFGVTDMFWILLVLASLAVVDKRGFRWLVPFFCVVALAIHEVFAAAYLPLIAIAVLYQFIKKPNANNFIFITACALIVGGASVYFIFVGDNTMKMTSDEMVNFATNRLDLHGNKFDDFYLRSIFYWDVPEVENYNGFLGYIKLNFEKYILGVGGSFKKIAVQVIANIITAIPFFVLMLCAVKNEKNRGKKFIFICSVLTVVPAFMLLSVSTDTERYSMHFVLNIIFLIIFFIKERDASFSKSYTKITEKCRDNKCITALSAIAILTLVLS